MAVVEHPHIVRLYDAREILSGLVFIMEHLEGGSLESRVTRPLPPEVAGKILIPVALAIQHAHDLGWLHLDIKPGNILLDGPSNAPLEALIPKVSDFGLAQRFDSEASWTLWNGPRGTPGYMAPEMLLARPELISPRCDIYSLGALLYRLLTGSKPPLPLSIPSPASYFKASRFLPQEPPPPPEADPAPPLAAQLLLIAQRCLQGHPANRYPTAAALADDLQRCLSLETPQHAQRLKPRLSLKRPALLALTLVPFLPLGGPLLTPEPGTPTNDTSTPTSPVLAASLDLQALADFNMPAEQVIHAQRLQQLDFYREQARLGLLQHDDLVLYGELAQRTAGTLFNKNKLKDSLPLIDESITAFTEVCQRFPADRKSLEKLSSSYRIAAIIRVNAGDYELGLQYYHKCGEALARLEPSPHVVTMLHSIFVYLPDLVYRCAFER